MEAKELRIGNWVQKDISVDDWNNIQLKIGDIAMYAIEELEGEDRELVTLAPIPLTEEWLEKFGFEDGRKLITDVNTGMFLQFFEPRRKAWHYVIDIDGNDRHFVNHVLYVHQLQNLYFALTGQELIIQQHEQSN